MRRIKFLRPDYISELNFNDTQSDEIVGMFLFLLCKKERENETHLLLGKLNRKYFSDDIHVKSF